VIDGPGIHSAPGSPWYEEIFRPLWHTGVAISNAPQSYAIDVATLLATL
jgi:hypothetical protein